MDKALRYLGLAVKAGRLIIGAEDCAKALKCRTRGLLIAASDAGGVSRNRLGTLPVCTALPWIRFSVSGNHGANDA